MKYSVIFGLGALLLWKLLSDFLPVEEFGGMDLRAIVVLASLAASAGITFSLYTLEKSLAEEQKTGARYSKPGRRKESGPRFEEIYGPKGRK